MKRTEAYRKILRDKFEEPGHSVPDQAWDNMNSLLDTHMPAAGRPKMARPLTAKLVSFLFYVLPAAAMIGTGTHFFLPGKKGPAIQEPVRPKEAGIDTGTKAAPGYLAIPPADSLAADTLPADTQQAQHAVNKRRRDGNNSQAPVAAPARHRARSGAGVPAKADTLRLNRKLQPGNTADSLQPRRTRTRNPVSNQ